MRLIFFLLLLVFIGCAENGNNTSNSKGRKVVADTTVSRAESWIKLLVDKYKSDYDTATSESSRDSIGNLYYRKIYDFLANHYINSIKVHVDTVLVTKHSIINRFHCTPEIVFRSEMRFPDLGNRKEDFLYNKRVDSLYKYLRSFRVGSDTMINFCFSGDLDLWSPKDSTIILKILAFPCPQLMPRE
jgi:hypothetical protein